MSFAPNFDENPSKSAQISPISPSLFPSLPSLITGLSALWTPPRCLPLSSWAEENITLSSEYAARATNLRLFGWQRAIFDSFTDPAVEETVLCCSTQLIKTLLMQCAVAYVACEDPGPILLVQPKEDDAKAFSRERLEPMQRDCACLRGRISDSKADGNLLLSKQFPGGSLSLIGARVPGNLARRSIRYLFADEIDKYPATVGIGENKEGDPLDLARERQVTFGSRKKRILACSPTVRGLSRIGKAYRASDMRKPWVPCPACGRYQVLDFFRGVKFDSSLPVEHRGPSAYYLCENPDCGAHWTDLQRKAACELAEWRAEAPFSGVAGFWISHLYSPWKTMSDIVDHFHKAKDDRQQYQVFVNTVLAQEWVDEGQTPDHQVLYDRRDNYAYGANPAAVVPARGLFLTAAVDVQDNPPRLEVETIAWGRGLESWSMDYRSIQVFDEHTGHALPVTARELWDKLDQEVLQRSWPHELGHQSIPIWVMLIDTGNRPKPVYEFARRHSQVSYDPGVGLRVRGHRTVVPIKGTPDPLKIVAGISKEDAARKRQGVRIVSIGTHCVKQQIYDALQHIKPRPDSTRSGAPSPGCYHHPLYDMAYFLGLTAEVKVIKESGKVEWENRGGRNEPFDCKVYNRAAATIVGGDRFSEAQWRKLEEWVSGGAGVPTVTASAMPESAPVTTPVPPPSPSTSPSPPPVSQPVTGVTVANRPVGPKSRRAGASRFGVRARFL